MSTVKTLAESVASWVATRNAEGAKPCGPFCETCAQAHTGEKIEGIYEGPLVDDPWFHDDGTECWYQVYRFPDGSVVALPNCQNGCRPPIVS